VALCLVAANRNVAVVTPDAEGKVVINTSELEVAILTVTRDVVIADPIGSKWPKQLIQLDITSDKPYKVSWSRPKFQERYAVQLPTVTSGPKRELWGIQYDAPTDTWDIVIGPPSQP
jgi:hypothetical protein